MASLYAIDGSVDFLDTVTSPVRLVGAVPLRSYGQSFFKATALQAISTKQ
jgi:hypothetical protein